MQELRILWEAPSYAPSTEAVQIPLDIIYEDQQIIVLNKQQGLAVHGSPHLKEPSLVQGLLFHYQDYLSAFSDSAIVGGQSGEETFRPGIVHRLDKDTSGLLIIGRNTRSMQLLAEQFAQRQTKKTYLALVMGCPRETSGLIDAALQRRPNDPVRFCVFQPPKYHGYISEKQKEASLPRGVKAAQTYYQVLRSWGSHSLLRLQPVSGRTHQIRVHLKHLGHPIVGDPLYGQRDPIFPDASLMLHAFKLQFRHPETEKKMSFSCPSPSHFRQLISALSAKDGNAE